MFYVIKANKKNLLEVATAFGVTVDPADNIKVLQAKIEADGITPEYISKTRPDLVMEMHPTAAEAPSVPNPLNTTPVALPGEVNDRINLVKMVRRNASYEIRGHKYTQDQPFNLVNDEDATFLVETDRGFTMASPSEVKAFYA